MLFKLPIVYCPIPMMLIRVVPLAVYRYHAVADVRSKITVDVDKFPLILNICMTSNVNRKLNISR
jgi:hypothetical protein